jgi:penicillin-binding protein 1A
VEAVLPGRTVDPRTPDAALVSIEPKTGFVKVMVGGTDYFGPSDYRQTNLAKGAGRQTGSAFKPIVMAAALANGVPTSRRWDAPGSVTHRLDGGPWTVSGGGIGSGNLEECTVVSSNTCYSNIILDPDVGPERSIEMAEKLGIVDTRLQANPAAVLGTNNATVEDMASVYATFADGGVHVPKVYVTRIQNADGTLLYEHQHSQTKVLEPEVARTVTDILPGVITRGTGKSADIGRPAGGKTGSSENNVDGWFCGFTPQLATAVWVGFAKPRAGSDGSLRPVPMQSPNTRITVFGGTYPAQIWARFMRSALADSPPLPLFDPTAIPPPTTTVAPSDAEALGPVVAGEAAEMPDVAGLAADRAVARIRSAGLQAEQLEAPAGSGTAGTVVGQSPPPGTEVDAGSTVFIEVAPAPEVPVEPVPDLRGFGGNQATEELARLGYTATVTAEAPPAGALRPDGQPYVAGQVWTTTPAAGTVAPDGLVTVVIMPVSAASTTTVPRGGRTGGT